VREWVTVYHGSINDATQIRASGLDAARLPTWITHDFAAARNAINPNIRAERLRDPGIIEARVPQSEFNVVLAPSERAYSGFNSALPGSSEIVIRTPEQAALFNRYIVT
jgi:hypothetical protein